MTTTFLSLKDKLKQMIGDEAGTYGNNYNYAINQAAREVYPYLFKYLREYIISGSALVDGSFEDWTSATALRHWTGLSGALARTSTAGYIRGARGSYSAKYTAGAASDYIYQSSNTYPKLLDFMRHSATARVWARPQTANDAAIVLYTIKADGTTQSLTSTTACPAGYWTLLELENQDINTDIVQFDFRLKVTTSGQYCYFDGARLFGIDTFEYTLPASLQKGTLTSIREQTSGFADDICDDLGLRADFQNVWGYDIIRDGLYEYLRFPEYISYGRNIELNGYGQLESDMDDDADTMSIDDEHVELLLMKAAYCLYRRLRGVPSSDSRQMYTDEFSFWADEFRRNCDKLRMVKPRIQMNIRSL